MTNYDFENILSPIDFEYLIRDLLSAELNIELTAFAEGKDQGIDLRYSKKNDSSIIVQCKRSKNISKATLEDEYGKIKKLNFEKYYFVTSCNLSVNKTDEIKEIFKEWIDSDEYIISRNKINQLLDKHKTVHRKHYKLWLSSVSILNTILNQHLYERSKSLITDIRKSYKYYAKNNSFNEAADILNKHKFLIISGIPGIGKTTLAKLLIWEYLQKEYEVIEIRKVLEGEQLLIENSENKQVFYFDDFLGENFLKYDVIEGRSYDLVQFINRIINNRNKILIMTTREYILKQAKEKYAKLNTDEFDVLKYTLDLDTYTKKIKSLILYNHLYYSNVSLDHIKNLIDTKSFIKIINHKNYSPRIIEKMTIKLGSVDPQNYSNSFIESLDNPFSIWDRAFKTEITEGAKYTLYILLSIGSPIIVSDIQVALNYFYEKSAIKYGINFKPIDYKDYLKELEGCFIKTSLTNSNKHYIEFQNPSIKDFLINLIKPEKQLIELILNSSFYFNQLIYVINYLCENFKSDESINHLISSAIIERFDKFENTTEILFGLEYKDRLKDINKIDALKNYISRNRNKSIEEFLFDKFEKINTDKLLPHEERKYLNFYSTFKDKLTIKIEELFNNILNNLSWFGNIKNFISLNSISPDFESFVKANQESIDDKITNVLHKEIEFSSSKSSLEDFKSKLEDELESIISISNIDYAKINVEISEKSENFENTTSEESDNSPIETKEINEEKQSEDELFNESDLFKIELFE